MPFKHHATSCIPCWLAAGRARACCTRCMSRTSGWSDMLATAVLTLTMSCLQVMSLGALAACRSDVGASCLTITKYIVNNNSIMTSSVCHVECYVTPLASQQYLVPSCSASNSASWWLFNCQSASWDGANNATRSGLTDLGMTAQQRCSPQRSNTCG
jgi:hypothetical protein